MSRKLPTDRPPGMRRPAPPPMPPLVMTADLSDSQLRALCAALGWQGGTYRQVRAATSQLRAAALRAVDALRNVPPVGEPYDQQHSDDQLRALVALRDALGVPNV